MANKHMDDFMAAFPHLGLTFDDVSLMVAYSDFLPADARCESFLSRNIPLNVPLVSAAMDTVTESEMGIAMAIMGGIGVLHKSLSIKRQAEEARRVKHYLNGLIKNPVVFNPDMTVESMLDEKELRHYPFTGFPIVGANNALLGIVTGRDLKFVTDYSVKLRDVMTTNVVTAREGTPITEAFRVMSERRIGKLPLVDANGCLTGLYSFHDVRSIIENINPLYNRDADHRLRVAAAIGPHDIERATALVEVGVDALVVDTAHGHSKGVVETVAECKRLFPKTDIIGGNVATAEGGLALARAGADGVKVGIGPGSICTTRVVAGVGIPQITAIHEVKKAVGDGVPVIADGGIKQSGDVAKAIAAGASSVMMGSALAGTKESPGEKIYHQGRTYVVYRGMGSVEAMKQHAGSRERYGVKDVVDEDKLVPQGIEGMVLYRGFVSDVIHQYVGGLRYSLGYCGARTVKELQDTARFVRVTAAGLREAHPHDVKIVKDAPNYSAT